MQVRKFEAKTIKDAIELVKFHMGPEAIILSAKDNSKKFGLMGEASVEVTAAVSESGLAKKKLAEQKLDKRSKEKYLSAKAKTQKEYIERVFEERMSSVATANGETETPRVAAPSVVPRRRGITAERYIDIGDEGDQAVPASTQTAAAAATIVAPAPTPMVQEKISSLQNEILHLRQLLERFQKVPQNFLSLHPGAAEGLPYELSFVFKKLLDAGIRQENIVEILKLANEILPNEQKKKKAFVDGWVIKYLLDHLQIVEKPFKSKYHIFLGPTGQGKTSTVVKIACHLLLKERKRVAILSGDHIKVGAKDQLKIYAQILNIPCGLMTRSQDWASVEKALENVDYVLLDTPGVNLRGANDLDSLRSVLPPNMSGMNVHYVQSIMARDNDAFEVAERFKVLGFDDVIFTRLDEAVQHGLIYNFQKHFEVPLFAFGVGNAIPEDFELATKERVVDLIFNLSKFKKERGNS